MHTLTVMFVATALTLAGCASVGPKTVPIDRADYGAAIADSWKQQTLLNIVKLRYMDLPVFMDVASVVAGYSLQTGVAVNALITNGNYAQGNYGSVGGQAIYTDRPTITYVPMTGEKFLRGLITPIDPKNIFFMLQAGYAADFVLGLTVESLNGVRNGSTARGVVREADPDFLQALKLMRDVQADGALGMRVEEDKARNATGVVFFRRDDVSPEIAAKALEIRRLLKLPAEGDKYTLIYSPARGAAHELTVNSRSMLQILGAIATFVDVPDEHMQGNSVAPTLTNMPADRARIHSAHEKPDHAFAAVKYRDYWFWVEESDFVTKRVLVAVMFFFTLADTGAETKLPLITIPAQ